MIDTAIRKENKPHWFVMSCRDAEKIEAYIDKYNANELVAPDDKVEDLFIPALAIRKRKLVRAVNDDPDFVDKRRPADEDIKSNEMRSTLRHFVFLYTRPSAFDRLPNHLPTQYWNMGHTFLHHYNDASGRAITVSPKMMNIFISGCLEYLEKFEIHSKETEITNGIEVTVREGAFKDFKAEVYNVHYKNDGIRFSIAIKFFANDKYIRIHDRRPEDVVLANQDSPVFSADFIDRIQSGLLDILHRRLDKAHYTDKAKAADVHQLHQLYYLRHAIIDDPLRSIQLDALMSICASLLKNPVEKSKYNRILKQRLKDMRSQQSSATMLSSVTRKTAQAYLLTALYISTKDAKYRTELKPLVLQDLPHHAPLRTFLSLIRK